MKAKISIFRLSRVSIFKREKEGRGGKREKGTDLFFSLGNDGFVGKLEEALGRILQRWKPGGKGGLSGNKSGVPLIPPV